MGIPPNKGQCFNNDSTDRIGVRLLFAINQGGFVFILINHLTPNSMYPVSHAIERHALANPSQLVIRARLELGNRNGTRCMSSFGSVENMNRAIDQAWRNILRNENNFSFFDRQNFYYNPQENQRYVRKGNCDAFCGNYGRFSRNGSCESTESNTQFFSSVIIVFEFRSNRFYIITVYPDGNIFNFLNHLILSLSNSNIDAPSDHNPSIKIKSIESKDYIFVSNDKKDSDNVVEARSSANSNQFDFQLIPVVNSDTADFYLYSPKYDKYVFVSGDIENGDNLVEARDLKEIDERFFFTIKLIDKDIQLYNKKKNQYVFVSYDIRNGDRQVEARSIQKDEFINRTIFQIEV